MDPFSVPNLDDYHFQDMVDTAKRGLNPGSHDWTDHNVSDPGITLIEACAQAVDERIFRINYHSDAVRQAILRRAGVAPMPATSARTTLTFTRLVPGGDIQIPQGTIVTTAGVPAIAFRTLTAMTMEETTSMVLVHAEHVGREYTGTFTATSSHLQRYVLPHRPLPVLSSSEAAALGIGGVELAALVVKVSGDGRVWQQVPWLAAASPGAAQYRWDPVGCRIIFGTATHVAAGSAITSEPSKTDTNPQPAIPSDKSTITVDYTVGGGVVGNVPPGALTEIGDPALRRTVSVTNEQPASGGQEEETWEDAITRVRWGLVEPTRAVTVSDYETIISGVPGVARIHVSERLSAKTTPIPAALRVSSLPPSFRTAFLTTNNANVVFVTEPKDQPVVLTAHPLDGGPSQQLTVAASDNEQWKKIKSVVASPVSDRYIAFSNENCYPLLLDSSKNLAVTLGKPISLEKVFKDVKDELISGFVAACSFLSSDPALMEVCLFTPSDTDSGGVCRIPCAYNKDTGLKSTSVTPTKSTITSLFPELPINYSLPKTSVAVVRHDDCVYFLGGGPTRQAVLNPDVRPVTITVVPEFASDPAHALHVMNSDAARIAQANAAQHASSMLLIGAKPSIQIFTPKYIRIILKKLTPSDSATAVRAQEILFRYFHPVFGGRGGAGWEWGRRAYPGDVHGILDQHGIAVTKVAIAERAQQAPFPSFVDLEPGCLFLLEAVDISESDDTDVKEESR
ncbi:baseplate J/gp47 family protein [Nocardia brasiliensis]|uniref:baseplate J/gp47 family protein n=1 Tax=Nocardia brasiliensis TaxID=37326 RepID=UPI0024589B9A|nr:baseplate J/gp47 family protein [Nocardia brasiliensis]